jgi:hypothetical protein
VASQGGIVGLADGTTGAADGTTGAAEYAQAQATAASAAAKQSAQTTAAYANPAYQSAVKTTEADIADNNFSGAWSSALSTSGLFGTNYNSATTDPLLEAMESSSGLKVLDPTKNWTAAEDTSFYNALGTNPVYNGKTTAGIGGATESLGKNPYGTWGSGAALTGGSDAAANIASSIGDTPNVEQFAGARPTKSFLSKYGADIGALAATALSFGVAAPALAGALAADGIASGLAAGAIAGGVMGGINTLAVDAITGAPITAGGVLGGALGGAAGGGLVPLAGGAINSATGLGSTISTGIAGAGIGAARSALTGGNVGIGALSGGVAGAVQGSGVLGNIKSGVAGATGSTAAGSLATAGTNYAIGGATGLAAGALMGSPTAAKPNTLPAVSQPSTMSQTQQVVPSSGALQMNAPINGMYNGVAQPSGANTSGAVASGATSTAMAAGPNIFGNLGSTSTQGTNGNMSSTPTSTDTSLASTITGALPGVLQAGVGTAGSLAAANAESNADQNAITTQQNNLGNINNIWSTQQQLGQGADTALGSALGTNGTPANYSNFENMPGYQFAVSQGTQAVQRQAAAMGSAYTPNTAAAVGQYVTGTASQDYNTYISQLMGAAGLGTTANQGLQTANQTTANNISGLQQNIGQAQAMGYTGVANSAGSLFGANGAGTSLINAAGKALGSSGGSGGSGGSTSSGGSMSANSGDTANGGVDPSTGIPYDIENPGTGTTPTTTTFDASNPLGISGLGSTTSDPNWNSVTDSTFNSSGDSTWNSLTDTGGSDATSFLGDW